jgi:hypothetical protein
VPFPQTFRPGMDVGWDVVASGQKVIPCDSMHQPLHGLKEERCQTDGSKIPSSTVGIPTRLRDKHYLNLAPDRWDVPSHQAGTKDLDQVRNKNLPSLLQQSREYPILTRILYGAKVPIAHSVL